ncbi:Spermatogenesis-associated protein 20 [Madurella mycetomatis]|uniref:Spermatogenesis-associated protein 20 n=1 Tax=Madurella mycetomatis TaxID=100816 RepID=A0A175WFE9_9PEZI|nr:Spermatogenesis-associated protein 20 [Madurella mycetomatis]
MMSTQREQYREQEHSERPDATPPESLRNRAGESDSPYVRYHAQTPVAWQLLDAATLARATVENKPIFMHIGFLADHLCHLTTQDSFLNPSLATFLNNAFIPIIVDREERPDLDTIYQNYSEAVNATGGWPLNLFLTPDLYPIFGGTYWPGPGTDHSTAGSAIAADNTGEESYNDFLAIAKKIHKFWVEQEERCRREAFEMLHKLQDFAQEGTFAGFGGGATALPTPPVDTGDLDLDQLDEALARISKMFDPVDYGFGTPKFPNPARLSFLLRLAVFPSEVRDVIGEREVANATSMAISTLRRIRDGGLRDHLGAGFMRFSATSDWSMPHFEKMVGENALLLGVFLDAWLGYAPAGGKGLALDGEFADVVLELADYLTSPLIRQSQGAFVTSEAADSFYRKGDRHMREGAYYLWTRREFDQVVGGGASDHASSVAAAYWNVLEDGNVPQDQDPFDEFINQNVLSINKDMTELSKQFGVPAGEIKRLISTAREKLRAHREKERVRPARDEKVVVGVNGMVISALSRTAAAIRLFDAERSARYLQAAKEAAAFIKEKLWTGPSNDGRNTLHRFFWNGPSQTLAFADDYAFLVDGLLDLYTATFEQEWLTWAKQLQDTQTQLFYDSPPLRDKAQSTPAPSPRHAYSGGFYSTESETLSPTILRLKSGMDKAQPSTNAVSASNLFRLGVLLASESYTLQAKETINAFEAEVLQYPWLFVGLLISVVTARLGVKKVSVERGDEKALTEFYTSPRAEAKVLLLVEKTGETDKASSERETVTRVVEGAAEELRSKVESMTIGSRP